jgi:hypothetical protein
MHLLITGGGHFKMTMAVDKNIMEFEKKGLGNSEKIMDFFVFALGGVQTCGNLHQNFQVGSQFL